MRACVAQCQNADPVFSRRNHAAHGALFFALAAGAASFLVSMALLLWLDLAAGIERFQIEFYTARKQPMSWREIASLAVSLGLSITTSEFVFRFCKKALLPANSSG
jgi:hypothetical protein